VTDYDRADTLGDELRALRKDGDAFRAACRAARQIYDAQYAWQPVRERIRKIMIAEQPTS
jgi:hypothetical protein